MHHIPNFPSMSALEQIPQEIYDLFIDHLSDSYCDLKHCTLVCKAWLPRSRRHLFRHVVIAWTSVQAQSASRLVDVMNEYYASFQDVFREPRIGRWVRGLTIEGALKRIVGDTTADPTESRPLLNHLSLPIASIQNLPFQNLRFLVLDWSVFERLVTSSSSSSFEAFRDAFIMMPHLECLMLKNYFDYGEFQGDYNDLFATLATLCQMLKMLCIEHLQYPALSHYSLSRNEEYHRIIGYWNKQRSQLSITPVPLKSLYIFDTNSFVVENIVLAVGCFQTSSLERIFISAAQLYLLTPYDVSNVMHLSLEYGGSSSTWGLNFSSHSEISDAIVDLTSKLALPSLKFLQLVVSGEPLKAILPLLIMVKRLLSSNRAHGHISSSLELSIRCHRPSSVTMVSNSLFIARINEEFEELLISDIGQNAVPLLCSISFNLNPEELDALFPKYTASGALKPGQGDTWWNVDYW